MAVRKFKYEFDGVHYYRFSVYRLGSNVQTVYTFVLDDVLIDTAQSHNRDNILQVAKDHHIAKIILTHHHEDHSGNVAFLMDELDIDAFAHPETVRILKKGIKVSPLSRLLSGDVAGAHLKPLAETDRIVTEKYSLQPIYTPGHCSDHYCYYEAEKGWMSRRDDRVRYSHDQHGGMDGQWRPLDGYFNSPSGARLFQPHDQNAPLSETANCRCFLLYRLRYRDE